MGGESVTAYFLLSTFYCLLSTVHSLLSLLYLVLDVNGDHNRGLGARNVHAHQIRAVNDVVERFAIARILGWTAELAMTRRD